MEVADKPKRPDYMTLVNMPKITEQRAELAAALALAQAEIDSAPKTEKNPFFKSTYADLATVRQAIREAFGKHGLSVIQIPHTSDDRVMVTTILMHKSGQFVEGTLALKPVKGDPQAIGSAITYARRYSLMAFAGVAPDDDDGNDASGKQQEATKNRSPVKPKQEPTHKEVINKLKAKLTQIGVEAGDKDTADAVLQYLAMQPQYEGAAMNWHMATTQEGPCMKSLDALAECHREFPPDCETPFLSIVREHQSQGPKATT